MRHAVALFVVLPARALLVGTRAPHAPVRAPAARADFASFEKSFKDELYKQDMLDKNKALRLAEDALPGLLNRFKADGLALREGIDECRAAGASVAELKQLIEALKKADPSLVTEVDEAILLGADQVREMSLPQPARPPQDSFLTEEQFQALREATKSPKECWDGTNMAGCPEEMKNIWGRPLIFFNICRNPRKDPTPKQWEALRKAWPILDGVPDDELMKNLVECRKEFCDVRFI